MRAKLFVIQILIGVLLGISAAPLSANTGIDDLVPNDYKENKFKKNNDLIHDQSLKNQKIEIPEEQKKLQFEGAPSNALGELKQNIFQGEEKGTNTIKAKAEGLKLFSQSDRAAKLGAMEEAEQGSSSLSILIAVFAGVCILLLILVIVIWNRTDQGKQVRK
nr:type VII secretion protein EssA [Rossellomorea vietnamensis]